MALFLPIWHGLTPGALNRCLMKFHTNATVDNLQSERKCLAGQWNKMKASHLEEYMTRTVEDGAEGQEYEEPNIVDLTCASCRN